VSPPSGEQTVLRHGPWEAVVVEVGGGLRALSHEGRPVGVWGWGARGQPLIPWPNRLAHGTYRWDGQTLRAPLDEPDAGNAIHGLARWRNWTCTARSASACRMELRLHPQPAYPFTLHLALGYQLGDDGLTVGMEATNAGDVPAPFGAGFHPYLSPGAGPVDGATATVPADVWLPVDGRGIPSGERRPVSEVPGLGPARPIGAAVLDHCFTDLRRDGAGRATVTLARTDGTAALWMDEAFSFCMVFTGDTLTPARRRRGLAVEPMTCAPDAFNSGDGLVVLTPDSTVRGSWGIAFERTG
jgi:aldose 1-epimerase